MNPHPAKVDRNIDRAFEFAKLAVKDPRILDVFADGMDVEINEPTVPNPHIPENAFIVTGTTFSGEAVKVAIGVCVCNVTRDESKGRFWLRAGESWSCPQCGRVYVFDGERIEIFRSERTAIG
jgi:hypothetical protein